MEEWWKEIVQNFVIAKKETGINFVLSIFKHDVGIIQNEENQREYEPKEDGDSVLMGDNNIEYYEDSDSLE